MNDGSVKQLSFAAPTCLNVALNKTLTATTHHTTNLSYLQTDGLVDASNCLADEAMSNPQVEIAFGEETEVRFLNIFFKERQSSPRE